MGSNDAVEVASYMGRNSTANVLLRFRQDEKTVEREMRGGTPNLGDVRHVDFKKVAARPRNSLSDSGRILSMKNLE